VTEQPGTPGPDHYPAEPPTGPACHHTTDHPEHPTGPGLPARVDQAAATLTTRTQARLARGAGRLRGAGTAYVLGRGLDLGDKAQRWSVLGLTSLVTERIMTAGAASCTTCLAAGTIALLGGCWHYGAAPTHPIRPTWPTPPAGPEASLRPATTAQPAPAIELLSHRYAEPEDERPEPALAQNLDQVQVPDLSDDARPVAVDTPHGPVAVERRPMPVAPVFAVQVVAGPTPPADQSAWVIEALAICGITGPKVLTVSHRPWGVVIEVEAPRGAKLFHERLDQIEAALRLPEGGLSFQVNPKDAGIITLRLRRTDPFTGLGAPHHHRPLSLSVRQALPVGLEMDGAVFALHLARVHMALVGGTGSGKSSALWTLIDALSACRDVVLVGIDLTGAPALMAWGDVIQELATTPEQAEALLTRLLKMGRGRGAQLGERSRPRLGYPAPDLASENWEPAPDGPQVVLIIDEYPALVEAGLWPYVVTMLKELRKAAFTIVLASQRATRNELGSTTVKAQIALKALLSCDAEDVKLLLGPGMHAKGWVPDRLQPSLGDEPYDAGTCYLHGGAHITPVQKKFYRLALTQVHHRALERMAAGLPQIDAATLAHAHDAEPVHLDLTALGKDQDADDTPALTDDQTRLLRAIADYLTDQETTRAHLRTLAGALTETGDPDWREMTATDLGNLLRAAGVEPSHSMKIDRHVNVGVLLDSVARRLNSAHT
jgi:FtsK/SpoIIIE family